MAYELYSHMLKHIYWGSYTIAQARLISIKYWLIFMIHERIILTWVFIIYLIIIYTPFILFIKVLPT